MESYPLDDFAREVADMPLNDEQDFLFWLRYASRLAMLGDRSQLDRWQELSQRLAADLPALFADRTEEGIWDLHNALGELLGYAVIAAQDFDCFLQLEGDKLPAEARTELQEWVDEADRVPLDADAVFAIEQYLRLFPIPEGHRIPIVHAPLTEFEEAVAAALAQPAPVQEERWDSYPQYDRLPQAADDDEPPLRLMEDYEIEEKPFDVEGVGPVHISRSLHPDWRVVVTVHSPDDHPLRLKLVRLGLRQAEEAPDDPGAWVVELKHFSKFQQYDFLRSPLVIVFTTGHRLRIS